MGSLVLVSAARAQDVTQTGTAAVAVEAAVGTAVAERALVGAADVFRAESGTLYCFTKISNAANTEIEHAWYHGDTEVSRVKLSVRGSPWRTWSTKRLPPNATGNWRCDVVQDGEVIKSIPFKVE